MRTVALFCTALAFPCLAATMAAARAGHHGPRQTEASRPHPVRHARGIRREPPRPPHAGHTQHGHASIYAWSLAGRRMADGHPFDPHADVVASRTLPLGSRARVTNLRNGRTASVQVRDRGPHSHRLILDVSPGVAARLGIGSTGTAPVAVTPEAAPGLVARAEAATVRGGSRTRR